MDNFSVLQTDESNTAFEVTAGSSAPASPPLPIAGVAPVIGTLHYGGLEPRQLRRVATFISENLAENIPIAALAAVAGLSPSYFCRAFKVSVGRAPHAHIIRLRIERAMALMLETEDPLSQIAVACGLSDQSHLSKLFRDLVGMTPAKWRHMRRH